MATSTPGSQSWRSLLGAARRLLGGVEGRLGRRVDWALGGGTVLMLRYAHRVSRDIAVFLHDPQLLPHLSPRLNDQAEAIARDFVEASSFVKLRCEGGEIDFIVAPDLTDAARETLVVDGDQVMAETPVEIVTKKAFYRAADLRPRDLFDLAVVIDRAGPALDAATRVLAAKRDVLEARLRVLVPRWRDAAAREIAVLPAGAPYLERAPALVEAFVVRLASGGGRR